MNSFNGKVSVVKCIQGSSTERLDTAMGKFSEAEIYQLRGNANVAHVSEYEVRFTEYFKQTAWEEKQSGKNLPTIFREHGIDPQIRGHKRIENFSRRLREKARNGENFSDSRRDNCRSNEPREAPSLEEKVRRLEHELAYTRQEVEFLKKIQMANTEARKRWESKHQPK